MVFSRQGRRQGPRERGRWLRWRPSPSSIGQTSKRPGYPVAAVPIVLSPWMPTRLSDILVSISVTVDIGRRRSADFLVRLAGVEPATLGLEVLLAISRKALRSQMFRLSSSARRQCAKVRSSAPSGESLVTPSVTVCVALCAVPTDRLVAVISLRTPDVRRGSPRR